MGISDRFIADRHLIFIMGSAQHPLVEELREGLVEEPSSATCLPDEDDTCTEITPEVSGLSGHQERWPTVLCWSPGATGQRRAPGTGGTGWTTRHGS